MCVQCTALLGDLRTAAVVGKSIQSHFLALKTGRGTLPTGLQRVKKTLLVCGVPSRVTEDAALLRAVGSFFGFQRHMMDFESILVNVEEMCVLCSLIYVN